MIFVYLILLVAFMLMSKNSFRDWFNPVTVFVCPWILMIVFYELKLIQYYELTLLTHVVLIITILLYVMGAVFGARYGRLNSTKVTIGLKNKNLQITESEYKIIIRKIIIITTIIGGVSTLLAIRSIINRYGTDFYLKVTSIYSDRLLGEFHADSISYIGSVFNISVLLSSIYFVKYGFNPVMIPVVIIIALKPFTGGARQSLVQYIVLFGMPFIVTWADMKNRRRNRQINKGKKTKILIIIGIVAMIGLLVFVSNQRSAYVVNSSFHNYATPGFEKVIERVPGLYQLYSYFASPVGVLNEFLKAPDFRFGANTLFPIYNVLNRIGFNIPVQRYQPFYRIPIPINVGTAVRELIEDYSVFGIVLVFFSGYCVGTSYKKYKYKGTVKSLFVVCFMYFLAFMSWYMWFLRDANLILALIIGCILCDRIDSYEIIDNEDSTVN